MTNTIRVRQKGTSTAIALAAISQALLNQGEWVYFDDHLRPGNHANRENMLQKVRNIVCKLELEDSFTFKRPIGSPANRFPGIRCNICGTYQLPNGRLVPRTETAHNQYVVQQGLTEVVD